MLGFVKRLAFGVGEQPRKILFGIGSGCRFVIDPSNKSQRVLGMDEAEIAALFRKSVCAAKTLIDVGASDGYYPIIGLHLNPGLTAVGCDCEPEMEQRARKNYALTFPATKPSMEWFARRIGNSEDQLALDTIAEGKPGPVLIKIDVEGFEVHVLDSGKRVLARPDCVVIVEVHSPQLEEETIKVLTASGFRCRIIKNAWWRLLLPELRHGLNRWVYADKTPA